MPPLACLLLLDFAGINAGAEPKSRRQCPFAGAIDPLNLEGFMHTVNVETPEAARSTILDADKNGWPEVPPGLHYPQRYEFSINIPDVGPIHVRPIRNDDAGLFEGLFKALSQQSVYLRFFSFLRQLPPQLLARLTQVNYDQEVVLVALQRQSGQEIMLGDARIVQTSDPASAEFSVVVRDELHGKGIGACLLQHCLAIARRRGFRHICGFVLPDNKQMLRLGRKLGFTIQHVLGSVEYELTIDFDRPSSAKQNG